MKKNLIQRIGERPLRYITQSMLTLQFITESLEHGVKVTDKIHNYASQIREVAGQGGYLIAQVGLPITQMAAIGILGYVATKGAGMFLDKHWYQKEI